jgi:uncharacterized membrane protein YfcA
MFGVGGSVVSTPAIRALGATPFEGVGSTVPATIPSAISGSIRYFRAGLIRGRVVAWVSPIGCLAAILGARLSRAVPGNGHILVIATAALMLFTAYRTARPSTAAALALALRVPPRVPILLAIGVASGLLSGLLGIGGGIFMVPAFIAVGLEIKEAVGTSLVCVGLFAVPSMITHAILGDINWVYALPLCVGVIPGARLGSALAMKAADRTLRYGIGIVLGIIAIIYAIGETLALI